MITMQSNFIEHTLYAERQKQATLYHRHQENLALRDRQQARRQRTYKMYIHALEQIKKFVARPLAQMPQPTRT